MAYRISRTERWNEIWWLKLSSDEKFLWQFLMDKCNDAGFYEIHLPLLIASTGMTEVQVKTTLNGLKDHYLLSTDKTVIWMKLFLKEQRKLPLHPANNEHKAIVSILMDYMPKFSQSDAMSGVLPTEEAKNVVRKSREKTGKVKSEEGQTNPLTLIKKVGKADIVPEPSGNELSDQEEQIETSSIRTIQPTTQTNSAIVEPKEKVEKEPKKQFRKPMAEQVMEYFTELLSTNQLLKDVIMADQIAKAYMDYYVSNGWRLGGKSNQKMQDWKATCRRWITNREESVLVRKQKLKSDGSVDMSNSPAKQSKAELILQNANEAKENLDWMDELGGNVQSEVKSNKGEDNE